jgi:type III pantothenate kinase
MQLVIDVGNTRVKAAVFEQEKMVNFIALGSLNDLLQCSNVVNKNISYCIFVTVIKDIENYITQLRQLFPVLVYEITTPIPIQNLYKTIDTLGGDRLVSVVQANEMFPNSNVLVIDAGTCVKYNFINSKNQFIGGAISPGIPMRYKALNTFTSKLPLLNFNFEYSELIGTSSGENIMTGVQMGAIAEAEGFINHYKETFVDLKIILTGGDAAFFVKQIKSPIFDEPYLLLKGLKNILLYNIKNNYL